jgi:DsbC/DsbD-like thiol-disulfide interchange protein
VLAGPAGQVHAALNDDIPIFSREVRKVRQFINNKLSRAALALLVVGALTCAALQDGSAAAAGKGKSEAKVSVKADKAGADGKQTIVVTLDINSGWHAYANPVGNEDFENNATVIKVSGKDKVAVKVDYPKGKAKEDKIVGNYNIYVGKVEIPVTVQRAAGDTGPLEVSVRYMTCSFKGVCLPAETVKVTVP